MFVSVGVSDAYAQQQSGLAETDSYQAGIPAFISATQHRVSFTSTVVSIQSVLSLVTWLSKWQ